MTIITIDIVANNTFPIVATITYCDNDRFAKVPIDTVAIVVTIG